MPSKTPPPSLCFLCRSEPPIRNSHVIPEFLYTAIYSGPKSQALKMTASTGKSTPVQVGFRAPILGKNCEAFVNDEYEQPFRRMWLDDGRSPTVAYSGGIHHIYVPDYRRFKLFLLSVLFRAGVCTVDPYAVVNIGPHENPLREMLVHGDARTPMEYPILGSVLLMPNSIIPCTMTGWLFETKLRGNPSHVFAFGGCLWEFPLTISGVPKPYTTCALADDGAMSLPPKDVSTLPALSNAHQVHHKNAQAIKGRKRK